MPAEVYTCDGFCKIEVPASPKLQFHNGPADEVENKTKSFTQGFGGVNAILGTGGIGNKFIGIITESL